MNSQRKTNSLTMFAYAVFAGFLLSTLLPGLATTQPAEAYRIIDTGEFVGQTVDSFEVRLAAGRTSSNETLYLPLNVSTAVVGGSLNVSGRASIDFTNLSGWGGATRSGENYGQAIHGYGDYNNDSYPDLAIGADFPSFGRAGRVDVLWGGPGGYGPSANWTAMGAVSRGFGFSLAHGDYNADGIDDLVVGEGNPSMMAGETFYLFYGSNGGLPSSPSLNITLDAGNGTTYGWDFAGDLDLNGDGFQDLVVGNPSYQPTINGNMGRIAVMWGGPSGLNTGAVTYMNGSTGDAVFGYMLYTLGDTDGDGADEFAVGGPLASLSSGRVTVIEGENASWNLHQRWEYNGTSGEYAGYAISGGVDLVGNSAPDLVVGAPLRGGTGGVSIFAGVGNAAYNTTSAIDMIPETTTSEQYGVGAETVGDIDGDGIEDLVVGANQYNNFDGRIYVYTEGNFSQGAALIVDVNSTGLAESYGWRVSSLGDGNADGYDDFAVNLATGINGTTVPGSVRSHYGGSDFTPRDVTVYVGDEPVWTLTGNLKGNTTVLGLGPPIQAYLVAHAGDADASGNVRVPISFNFSGGGAIFVSDISVRISLVLTPVGVRVTAPPEGRSLTLDWDLHATDGTLFTIWSNASGTWQPVGNQTLPRTSYTVGGLTDGVRYWFYLTETDPLAGLTGPPSAIVSAVPQDIIAPAMPTNFSLIPNPSNHSARLGWTPNSVDTVAYEVLRRAGAETNFSLLTTVPHPGLTYTDPGLSEEVTYTYRVRAVDPAGLFSSLTGELSMTINDLTPPSTPQNVVAQAAPSGTGIQVQWDANLVDTVSYDVFFGTINDTSLFTIFGGTNQTSLTITGLNRDNTYYVAVQAIDKVAHRSPFSAIVAVTTLDTQPPFAPVLTSATPVASGNTVFLEWIAGDDDIDGFRVYTREGGPWVEVLQLMGAVRSVDISGLTDGQPYEFRIAGFDIGGRLGQPSNTLTATPADTLRPGEPPDISVSIVPAGRVLTITWTAPADTDLAGYNIYFLDPQSGGGFQLAATVGPGVTTWTQEGLTNGLSYSYEVAAFDEVPNESPRGPRVVGVPQDSIPPDAPTFDTHPTVTNSVAITLTGSAQPGAEVQVFIRGNLRETARVDSSGHFSVEVYLGPGENAITAKTVDIDPAVAPQYKTSAESTVMHITLDTDKPLVTGRTPAENANSVDPRTRVEITFNEPVEATSLSLTLRDASDAEVSGTVTLDPGGRNAKLTPDAPLAEGADYTVVVVARDLAGNVIDTVTYTFQTSGEGSATQGDGGLPGLGAPAALATLAMLAGVAWLGRQRRRA